MFLCAPASEEIKTAITNLDPANSADAVNKAPNMHSSIKEKLSQFGTDIADELRNGFHSSYNKGYAGSKGPFDLVRPKRSYFQGRRKICRLLSW